MFLSTVTVFFTDNLYALNIADQQIRVYDLTDGTKSNILNIWDYPQLNTMYLRGNSRKQTKKGCPESSPHPRLALQGGDFIRDESAPSEDFLLRAAFFALRGKTLSWHYSLYKSSSS